MHDTRTADGRLTPDERAWLAAVEAEWRATTPGTWYAHATDDDRYQNARYVSAEPSETGDRASLAHDDGQGMAEGSGDQADPRQVVAITLLQSPRLADVRECNQNTLFIANVHQHMARLLTLVGRLDEALGARETPR